MMRYYQLSLISDLYPRKGCLYYYVGLSRCVVAWSHFTTRKNLTFLWWSHGELNSSPVYNFTLVVMVTWWAQLITSILLHACCHGNGWPIKSRENEVIDREIVEMMSINIFIWSFKIDSYMEKQYCWFCLEIKSNNWLP